MSVDGRLRNELSDDASHVDVDVDQFLDSVITRGRRRQRIRRVGGVVTLAALIAIIALVGPPVLDVIRQQHDQPAAPASAMIEGTYAVRITPADTAALDARDLDGLWQFALRGDGLLTAQGPPATPVSTPPTQYHIEGDQLLTTALQSRTCPGVGVYRWSLQGSRLTLTLISDRCPVRVALFTAHPWDAR